MDKRKADKIAAKLATPAKLEPPTKPEDLLGTGSTLLNLALSGKVRGGIKKGFLTLFIGKPQSGKTWLSFNALAEAANSKDFTDYRLIFDNVENGDHIDTRRYFGEKLWAKLEAPRRVGKEKTHSRTVEDFYYHIDDALQAGKPFVYVLDSMDGLSCEDDDVNFTKNKNLNRAGKEKGGTYGMSKAKENSRNLRVLAPAISELKSIVIIICQTRDNIGFGSQYNPDKHSGGNSLDFYARQVIWTKSEGRITNRVRGHEIDVGGKTVAKITKNSINGFRGSVRFPITRSVGVEDVASMLDFLVDWKHWTATGKEEKKVITATEFDKTMPLLELVKYVEDNGMEMELRSIVAGVWDDVEKECNPQRKSRYG